MVQISQTQLFSTKRHPAAHAWALTFHHKSTFHTNILGLKPIYLPECGQSYRRERERDGEVGVVKDKDKARKNSTMQGMRTRHDKTEEDKRWEEKEGEQNKTTQKNYEGFALFQN